MIDTYTYEFKSEHFDRSIEPETVVRLIEMQCIKYEQSGNDSDVQADILNELDRFHIITTNAHEKPMWVNTPVQLNRKTHKRSKLERWFYRNKETLEPLKPEYHQDNLTVHSVMNVPATFALPDAAQDDLKNGAITPFSAALAGIYHEISQAITGDTIDSLNIYDKPDAISNMNELNGWLKGLQSDSADMLIDTFDVCSLRTVVETATLCYN